MSDSSKSAGSSNGHAAPPSDGPVTTVECAGGSTRNDRRLDRKSKLKESGAFDPNIERRKKARSCLRRARQEFRKAISHDDKLSIGQRNAIKNQALATFNKALGKLDTIAIHFKRKPNDWGDNIMKLLEQYALNPNIVIDEKGVHK